MYFWNLAYVPCTQGFSRFLLPSRHLSSSCTSNLCKPLAIMSHSSTFSHLSFGLRFLSHQLLRALPLLDPFLHPFSPLVPTIAIFALSETLSISTSGHFTNLLIVYFICQDFPKYHSQHLHFCSLDLLTSSTFNAQHSAPFKLKRFSQSFCIRCL